MKWRIAEHCKHFLEQINRDLSFLRNTVGACRSPWWWYHSTKVKWQKLLANC